MTRISLTCPCGESWHGAVPRKFRTKEFFEYVLAAWAKKHGGCGK